MSYIDRIRSGLRNIRLRTTGSSSPDVREDSDLPLDHQLTFRRDGGEKWTYRDGRIFINDDIDVEDLIDYESRDVGLWCGVSSSISEYRAFVIKKGGAKGEFLARTDAIQQKILRNMKRLLDEKSQGYLLDIQDDDLVLNNFRVRAFLTMYHFKPTAKARKFLLALRSKLALILASKGANAGGNENLDLIKKVYEEVLSALEIQPIESRRLAAGCGDSST